MSDEEREALLARIVLTLTTETVGTGPTSNGRGGGVP